MEQLLSFIQALAEIVKFKTEQEKTEFIGEVLALFVEDLIGELYAIPEHAELVELYEEEIGGYQHHEDILKATDTLLGKIPVEKRMGLVAKSFRTSAERLVKGLVEDKVLTPAQVKEVETRAAELYSAQTKAAQLQTGDSDAGSVLKDLAK